MSYRTCCRCKEILDDKVEVFTYAGDTIYLCDSCANDVSDFIDSTMTKVK